MLSDRVIEVLQGPAIMHVATRSERLRPFHAPVIGAVVHPDRETVTFFVAESRSERLLSDVKNNGKIALAFGIVTHETYQIKGSYLSSRLAETKEQAMQEIYRAKVLSSFLQAGYPEQVMRPYILGVAYRPSLAITFRVEEVFLQTPGPEAGKQLI